MNEKKFQQEFAKCPRLILSALDANVAPQTYLQAAYKLMIAQDMIGEVVSSETVDGLDPLLKELTMRIKDSLYQFMLALNTKGPFENLIEKSEVRK